MAKKQANKVVAEKQATTHPTKVTEVQTGAPEQIVTNAFAEPNTAPKADKGQEQNSDFKATWDASKPDISDTQKEQAKAETPEQAGKKAEDPKNTEPADTAIDVQPPTQSNDGDYTVEEGDLINYPELKDQVKAGDKVLYGSLYVMKSIEADTPPTTRVPWPMNTNPSYNGITFKQQ